MTIPARPPRRRLLPWNRKGNRKPSGPPPPDRVAHPADPSSGKPGPSTPADERVQRLLQEISELRLSAATHLTVAAAAMDLGRPDIATELIEAQQRDVEILRLRAEELLGVEGLDAEQAQRIVLHDAVVEESSLQENATLSTRGSRRASQRSRQRHEGHAVATLPRRSDSAGAAPTWSGAGALLAIAATVAIALFRPLAPATPEPAPSTLNASAVASLNANVLRSYGQLQVTAKPKTPREQVEEAAQRLHADLQRLLPAAANDPAAARRVLAILKAERDLLAKEKPGALDAFAPEAARIVSQLRTLASADVLAILPLPADVAGSNGQAPDLSPAVAPKQAAPAAAGDTSGDAKPADPPAADAGSGGQAADPAPVPVPVVPDPPSDAAPPATGGGDPAPAPGSGTTDGGGAAQPQVPDAPSLPVPPLLQQLTP
jgi:hypothetical protein